MSTTDEKLEQAIELLTEIAAGMGDAVLALERPAPPLRLPAPQVTVPAPVVNVAAPPVRIVESMTKRAFRCDITDYRPDGRIKSFTLKEL